jgi:hypothetical protein
MATTADAELILKLYDLRRESVCREARKFFVGWAPKDADEAKNIGTNFVLQENAYVRQVSTYWEMAFSIVNTGAIDEELFAKNCGEGIICVLKCQHLAKKFPGAWTRTMAEGEAFIAKNAMAKQKAEAIAKRMGF